MIAYVSSFESTSFRKRIVRRKAVCRNNISSRRSCLMNPLIGLMKGKGKGGRPPASRAPSQVMMATYDLRCESAATRSRMRDDEAVISVSRADGLYTTSRESRDRATRHVPPQTHRRKETSTSRRGTVSGPTASPFAARAASARGAPGRARTWRRVRNSAL